MAQGMNISSVSYSSAMQNGQAYGNLYGMPPYSMPPPVQLANGTTNDPVPKANAATTITNPETQVTGVTDTVTGKMPKAAPAKKRRPRWDSKKEQLRLYKEMSSKWPSPEPVLDRLPWNSVTRRELDSGKVEGMWNLNNFRFY